MNNIKKQFYIFYSIFALFGLLGIVFVLAFFVSPSKAESLRTQIIAKFSNDKVEKIKFESPNTYDFFSQKEYNSNTECIDSIRYWLFSNTKFGNNANYSYTLNTSRVLEDTYYSFSNKTEKPILSTFPYILALKTLYEIKEIPSRIINAIYFEDDFINTYSFLEVYNKDTDNWEISDPVKNIYYLNVSTNKRLNVFDLRANNYKDFVCVMNNFKLEINEQIHPIFNHGERFQLIEILQDENKDIALLDNNYYSKDKYYLDGSKRVKLKEFLSKVPYIIEY